MPVKQEHMMSLLTQYIREQGLQILETKAIEHGQQYKLASGIEKCTLNVYHTGKMVVGGKPSKLRQQLQEWANVQTATMAASSAPADGLGVDVEAQNHGTKYIVSAEKWEKVRAAVDGLEAQVEWREPGSHEVYKADIRADGDRVVLTQFRTGTLLVQGRSSELFHSVCGLLDSMFVQSPAEHATRYVTEAQASHIKPQMERPEAEERAWQFLENELNEDILGFIPEHDRNTLIAGAMLLEAAKELPMPDYSPLVMPFARAYEGYLIRLFIEIGFADQKQIEDKDIEAIQIGAWLDQLPKHLKHGKRDGHIVADLKSAWEGTRHITIHSDPNRQMAFASYDRAKNEICGVLMRAINRGYEGLVRGGVPLVAGDQAKSSNKKTAPVKSESQEKRLQIDDEQELLRRLKESGYMIETIESQKASLKWRVKTECWSLVCPRKPGNKLVVSGEKIDDFLAWYDSGAEAGPTLSAGASIAAMAPHIGADEAGKGDYYGPLVVAAVYVDEAAEADLIRWGVRDSKSLSDNTIIVLAEKIQARCPHKVVAMAPPEYNAAYREHQNLNRLLAATHARAIQQLVQSTGCTNVVVDQFASPDVLEEALDSKNSNLRLSQRTHGESDIAVAAASILARAEFVEAINSFRDKSGLEIPMGASAPEVISIGREIVRTWGSNALERIAKVDFKTTKKILDPG